LRAIVESIVLHEALHKRKPFLDSLADGLQVSGVWDIICHFPDVFYKAFVFSGKVTPSEVLAILKPSPDEKEMNENAKRVWKYVMEYVTRSDKKGLIAFQLFRL